MNIKNHIIFNIFIFFIIKNLNLLYFSTIEWNLMLFISILSCLLPDIDHPNSFIGRKIKLISKFINKTFGHRKITHSIVFLLILYTILILILKYYSNKLFKLIYYGITIGFFSHILADMMTKKGVSLLWPIKYKFKIKIINIILLIFLIVLFIIYI